MNTSSTCLYVSHLLSLFFYPSPQNVYRIAGCSAHHYYTESDLVVRGSTLRSAKSHALIMQAIMPEEQKDRW